MSRLLTKPTKWAQYPPSLIRVFAVRMKKAWALSYPLSARRRLWADAQADLSLRWAHMSVCWFCQEAAQICFCRCCIWQVSDTLPGVGAEMFAVWGREETLLCLFSIDSAEWRHTGPVPYLHVLVWHFWLSTFLWADKTKLVSWHMLILFLFVMT